MYKHGHKPSSGNFLNPGNSELLGNSVQPQGQIVANKIMLPDVVSGVQKCSKIFLPQITIITITFCCDTLQKSKFMAPENPIKLGEIFCPTLWLLCVCDAVQWTVMCYM